MSGRAQEGIKPAVSDRYGVSCANCKILVGLWTKPGRILCSENCFNHYISNNKDGPKDFVDGEVKRGLIPQPVAIPTPPQPKVFDVSPLVKYLKGDFTYLPIKEGETYFVTVTYMNGLGDVYVQLKEFAEEFQAYANDIKGYFAGYPISTSREEIGDIVFAPFDSEYYRCQILKIDEERKNADVIFLDYGNLEKLKIADLYFVPPSFLKKPINVIRCQWNLFITKEADNDELDKLLFPYSTGATMKFLKKISDGEYLVETEGKTTNAIFNIAKAQPQQKTDLISNKMETMKLYDTKLKVNESNPFIPASVEKKMTTGPEIVKVAEIKAPTGSAKVPLGTLTLAERWGKDGIYLNTDMPISKNIKTNTKVRINFAFAPHFMLIGSPEDDKDLGKLATLIDKYTSSGGGKLERSPVLGEVLLGLYIGEYFRGVITSVDEGEKKAKIDFIDYGDSITAGWTDLRLLSKDIANTPRFGLFITLDNIPVLTKKDLRKIPKDVETILGNEMILELTSTQEPWTAKLWVDDQYNVNAIFNKIFT